MDGMGLTVWLLSFSRWWWFHFFWFHPETLGKSSILTSIFSNGLVQPPMVFHFPNFTEKRGANFFWMTSGLRCLFYIWPAKELHKKEGCKYWVVVSNIFYFHPYLGKISNLTNIFQRSWNHQRGLLSTFFGLEPEACCNVRRKLRPDASVPGDIPQ